MENKNMNKEERIEIDEDELSDTDYESDEDTEEDGSASNTTEQRNILPLHNYTEEIATFYIAHERVSTENALSLNKKMQQLLLDLKCKLEGTLEKCREKYKKNEDWLVNGRHHIKKSLLTYYHCGAPFFKDKLYYPAPMNSDYQRRKNEMNEFFPIDIELLGGRSNRHWNLEDKVNLVQGVKHQLLKSLQLLYRSQTKKSNNTSMLKSKKVVELLKEHEDIMGEFKIDWYRVSKDELAGRHSENECCAMWNAYLKPELDRSKWKPDEEQKLLKAAEKFKYQNWKEIAKEVGKRSAYQCHFHFQVSLRPKLESSNKWTKEDDQLLLNAVATYRMGKIIPWGRVMSHFQHKSRKQIYIRYRETLNPDLIKAPFTPEEDCIIMAAIQEYGDNFTCIPMSLFSGRSITQVRNRYCNVLRHNQTQKCWSIEDDKKLLELTKEHGTSNWSKIAQVMVTHTRTSCRTRYSVINKFLTKNPNGNIEDIPRKKRGKVSDVSIDNWVEKIIEIKNTDRRKKEIELELKKNRRKPRMNFSKLYFDFFKYSYDYKFGKDRICEHDSIFNLKYLLQIFNIFLKLNKIRKLEVHFTSSDFKQLEKCILEKNKILPGSSKLLWNKSCYLTPNWSTLLGLRGVSIMLADEMISDQIQSDPSTKEKSIKKHKPKTRTKPPKISNSNDKSKKKFIKIANHNNIDKEDTLIIEAKKKFKQRFFMAFYQTSILRKFKSNTTPMQNVFEVRFLPNDSTNNDEIIEIDNDANITEYIEDTDYENICNPETLKMLSQANKIEINFNSLDNTSDLEMSAEEDDIDRKRKCSFGLDFVIKKQKF